jgi:hypothetical protein
MAPCLSCRLCFRPFELGPAYQGRNTCDYWPSELREPWGAPWSRLGYVGLAG